MKQSIALLFILISCSFAKAQFGSGYGIMPSDSNKIKANPRLPKIIKESTDNSENISFTVFLGDSSYYYCNNCDVISFKGKILNRKEYFDERKTILKSEFNRIDTTSFLYLAYDSNRYKTSEGVVKIDFKLSKTLIDTFEVLNNGTGDFIGLEIKQFFRQFLVKNGEWMEIISNNYQYNGQYINGIKEGLWKEQRNYSKTKHSAERNLYYKDGIVIKIDTINQVLYNKPFTKKQLCKYWGEERENAHQYDSSRVKVLEVLSMNSYPQFSYQFFENNKVRIIFRDCFGSDETGNWRIEGNKIIFWRVKGKERSSTILSYNEKNMVLGE